MRARTCQACRHKFTPLRNDAKTCSDACRMMLYRQRLGVTARKLAKRNIRRRCSAVTSILFTSKSDLYPAPQDLFDKLNAEFGFTLDVCATAENAKCERFYTLADDGLKQPWQGVCWMNPPYGKTIGLWMTRACEAAKAGATVVCLVPARTDTRWWHQIVQPNAAEIRFLPGRLRFGNSKHSAPFPNAIVVFRP